MDNEMEMRPCCVEHNFQFVTETPTRGFMPDQRFHIRSHVMKQFRRNQRNSRKEKNAKTSTIGKGTHASLLRREADDDEGLEKDNQLQADPMAFGTSGSGLPRRQKILPLIAERKSSRQAVLSSTSSALGSRKSVTYSPPSSTRDGSRETSLRRCPYCGAVQDESPSVDEERAASQRTSTATVLWRQNSKSGLVEPLGAGRVDPFQSYPVEEASPYLHELMDHAITYLLPGLVPDTENNAVHPLSKAWLSSGLEHPLLFHAMVFAGSIHLDFLRSSQIYPDKPLSLSHKLVVIRKVNECISDPNVASRDEVILAILILASHEAMNRSAGKENPFNSPLKNAQWLNIYSTITYVPEHMEAVLNLVTLRGGLENIKMFGLAEVIAAGDVVSASNSLSKPFCPLLKSSEAWLDYVEIWATSSPRQPVQELARGFKTLQKYGISIDVIKFLSLVGAVTMAIDHYLRGEPAGLTLGAIAKVRTAAQHRILSLPLSVELQDPFALSPHIYEACRTTALIYGIAVIFPISNAYNLLQDLTRRLKASLTYFKMDGSESGLSGLYLWMLVLGGIAASDGPERPWFATQLGSFAVTYQMCDWSAAQEILKSFLWLESACGAGGRNLWMEAMKEIRSRPL